MFQRSNRRRRDASIHVDACRGGDVGVWVDCGTQPRFNAPGILVVQASGAKGFPFTEFVRNTKPGYISDVWPIGVTTSQIIQRMLRRQIISTKIIVIQQDMPSRIFPDNYEPPGAR